MTTKTKILIGILLVVVILIVGWLMLILPNQQSLPINECQRKQDGVMCTIQGDPLKAGFCCSEKCDNCCFDANCNDNNSNTDDKCVIYGEYHKCQWSKLQEVTITTDKTEYEQGEIIQINVSIAKIEYIPLRIYYLPLMVSASDLQVYKNGEWVKITFNSEDYAECTNLMFISGTCKDLSTGESYQETWNQNIFQCKDGEANYQKAPLGKYRFVFHYWIDGCYGDESRTIYSNEFRISEIISQQIINKCKEEEKFVEEVQSNPDCLKGKGFRCVDGWGGTTYYDKRQVSTSTIETASNWRADALPSFIPEDTKGELEKATIAEYSRSSCSCEKPIGYKILIKDKLEEVSCEEFYQFLQNYESSCENCILMWSYGCC